MTAIRVLGPGGKTALLTPAQLKTVEPVVVCMLNGKLSLQTANAVIVLKLEDAGMPIQFEAPPCNTEPE